MNARLQSVDLLEFWGFHRILLPLYDLHNSIILAGDVAHLVRRGVAHVCRIISGYTLDVFWLLRSYSSRNQLGQSILGLLRLCSNLFFRWPIQGYLPNIGSLSQGNEILKTGMDDSPVIMALSSNSVVFNLTLRINLHSQSIGRR